MSETIDKTCDTCVFWNIDHAKDVAGHVMAACTRRAPVVIQRTEDGGWGETTWPRTSQHDYCGEWSSEESFG